MSLTVIIVGVIASALTAVITREVMLWIVVQPLRRESETRLEKIRAAQIDVNLVKAIRSGELDAAELAAAGVLDDISDGDHPALTAAAPDLSLDGPTPRFVPTFYRRNPNVAHLDPGDEVWIEPAVVYHAEDGVPVVRSSAATSIGENSDYSVRLRVYTDESLELGTRHRAVINDRADPNMSQRTVARLFNLDTDEIREVTQTRNSAAPDEPSFE